MNHANLRSVAWRMPLDGTTRTLGTDVGSQGLMSPLRCSTRTSRPGSFLHQNCFSFYPICSSLVFQDPFVAIVVDPIRTISAGKVNLGAFRTYPKGYKPPDDNASEYQTIPLNKIEDFGVHCKQYYRFDQFLCPRPPLGTSSFVCSPAREI